MGRKRQEAQIQGWVELNIGTPEWQPSIFYVVYKKSYKGIPLRLPCTLTLPEYFYENEQHLVSD